MKTNGFSGNECRSVNRSFTPFPCVGECRSGCISSTVLVHRERGFTPFYLMLLTAVLACASVLGHSSHPPLHEIPEPSQRPVAEGATFFVDGEQGDDAADGTESAPWRTIQHALDRLTAGETLLIRGGRYFENLYCAMAGAADKPITVRGYPGETVILDGGLREFQDEPTSCWEPVEDGEFRSRKSYRNIRDVLGSFADSNIGLQTYWSRADLRAENEMWIVDKETKAIDPVYCGPGLWYDKQSGRIHCRLAPTHIDNELVPNYQGEIDPRKLSLVISPFDSTPLFIDQAKHLRFQDLVILGGGFNTIEMNMGIDIEFDNLTVFCGTYGIRSRATGPFKMTDCSVHGGIPPWAFRSENSLHTHSPRHYDPFIEEVDTGGRNIARLNTHALVVTEGTYEFEVFAYPRNHDWEISHCTFTDGHDGVYMSGSGIRFHHNRIDNIQDDAIYLTSPSRYFSDDIHIFQNVITRSLMAFGCHSRGGPTGDIHVYRNICDLRRGVNISRPSPDNPRGRIGSYHIFLVHGRKLLGIEAMRYYHNTLISPTAPDAFAHRLYTSTAPETERRVFNNICVYLNRVPWLRPNKQTDNDTQLDGNLHWFPDPAVQPKPDFLEKVRHSPFSEADRERYPAGWAAQSLIADPQFVRFDPVPTADNDYRIGNNSPVIDGGIRLPDDWADPLRDVDAGEPDIGALPLGVEMFTTGRRIKN